MRELRKSNDRKLFGVAGGFAEYFGMDKTLWRVGWVIASICLPPLVLAYLILGIVLPAAPYYGPQSYSQTGPSYTQQTNPWPGQPPQGQAGAQQTYAGPDYTQQAYSAQQPPPRSGKRLTKSRDRWLSGVAAGVAEYLDLDPVLVRMLFLASLFVGGTGLLAYVVLAIVMPGPDYSYQSYQPR